MRRCAPPTSAHNGRLRSNAPLRSPRPALVAPLPRSLARLPRATLRTAPPTAQRAAFSVATLTALRALPRPAHDTRPDADSRPAPPLARTMPVRLCPGKTYPAGDACHATGDQSPRHRCAASPPHDRRRGRSACHVAHIVRPFTGAPTPKRIQGKRTAHTC